MTPAEQIAEFVRRHPGEWRTGDWRADGSSSVQAAAVLPVGDGLEIAVVATEGEYVAVWAIRPGGHHIGHVSDHVRIEAPLLARIAARVADCVQLRGIAVADLPAWLQDETRRVLRRRAGELLTAAGFSPADVVSAAETLDEALCARAPVAPTFDGVVNALQAIGMSCRWIGGDPLILVGDHVYIRDDLPSVPIDDFAAFTEKHGERRMVKGDKSGAPAVPGYRVFMALAPLPQ